MKYEDLSFTVKYTNGEEVINDITAVIPNPESENEPYVTYTDYSIDDNDEFRTYYGKLSNKNGIPIITRDISENEIIFIKDSLKDEIVKSVNDVIMDNLAN